MLLPVCFFVFVVGWTGGDGGCLLCSVLPVVARVSSQSDGFSSVVVLLFHSHQSQTTCWDHPKMTELYQSLGKDLADKDSSCL